MHGISNFLLLKQGYYTAKDGYQWLIEQHIMHCLRDFPSSKTLWCLFGFQHSAFFTTNNDPIDWIEVPISEENSALFLAGLWSTWRGYSTSLVS
jgi:hypothetical protein